ncbi:dephospho-CoA kinase [Neocloeon triangulifer]|uniref:dephospho-CoA kinase n=1 Tax=Neocloeon triangulifer TaxID=2078957 RepID=UPI00286F7180|nr:dephospho-CoA kinase [Neocloeon triangulifer]
MFIVGLTGGIGTGKSTASKFFLENDIPVVDADTMARKVVEPGRKAWKAIRKEFGESVFYDDGQLNREALGDLIFNDVDKRKKLNEITHPEIYKEMLKAAWNHLLDGHQFIVMDLPLLFESGRMLNFLHKIIVVTCEEDQQLERVIKRGQLSEERAKARINAQMPLETKCNQAHFVLDNTEDIDHLKKQVEQLIVTLRASNAHWKMRIYFIASMMLIFYLIIFLYSFLAF